MCFLRFNVIISSFSALYHSHVTFTVSSPPEGIQDWRGIVAVVFTGCHCAFLALDLLSGSFRYEPVRRTADANDTIDIVDVCDTVHHLGGCTGALFGRRAAYAAMVNAQKRKEGWCSIRLRARLIICGIVHWTSESFSVSLGHITNQPSKSSTVSNGVTSF